MTPPRTPRTPYGGDRRREPWPEAAGDEDDRLFARARTDTLTVGVFSWPLVQPAEDTYDFTALDRVLDRAVAEGRQVCLATGTAALPPWLVEKYPEANRTDSEGRRHLPGRHHAFCPSSPAYRRLATALAGRLAERYAAHPALLAWHINNEYGGACHCDLCADAFRAWLQGRHGIPDALADAWWTAFRTHRRTAVQEQEIAPYHHRFTTEALLGCFLAEKEVIRSHDPDTPVTADFVGMFRPWATTAGRLAQASPPGTAPRPRTPRPPTPPPSLSPPPSPPTS